MTRLGFVALAASGLVAVVVLPAAVAWVSPSNAPPLPAPLELRTEPAPRTTDKARASGRVATKTTKPKTKWRARTVQTAPRVATRPRPAVGAKPAALEPAPRSRPPIVPVAPVPEVDDDNDDDDAGEDDAADAADDFDDD